MSKKRSRTNLVGDVTSALQELRTSKIWSSESSPLLWLSQKPSMIHEFVAADNCYDLMIRTDPPVPSHLTVENAAPPKPQEVPDRIKEEIKYESDLLKDVYIQERNAITLDNALTNREKFRAQILLQLQDRYEENRVNIERKIVAKFTDYNYEYQNKYELYKEFKTKCQSATKCFLKIFSREFLQQYLTDINAGKFRKVWSSICERYESADAISPRIIFQTLEKIANMQYDVSATMQEHFYVYEQRLMLYRTHGYELSDELAIHYFIKMIEVSQCHQRIKLTVGHISHRLTDFTWDTFKTKMLNTFSNLVEEGAISRALPLEERGVYKDSEVVTKSKKSKTNKTRTACRKESKTKSCDYCKSKGFSFYKTHNTKMCYRSNPCKFCNKPHDESRCNFKFSTSIVSSASSQNIDDQTEGQSVSRL